MTIITPLPENGRELLYWMDPNTMELLDLVCARSLVYAQGTTLPTQKSYRYSCDKEIFLEWDLRNTFFHFT